MIFLMKMGTDFTVPLICSRLRDSSVESGRASFSLEAWQGHQHLASCGSLGATGASGASVSKVHSWDETGSLTTWWGCYCYWAVMLLFYLFGIPHPTNMSAKDKKTNKCKTNLIIIINYPITKKDRGCLGLQGGDSNMLVTSQSASTWWALSVLRYRPRRMQGFSMNKWNGKAMRQAISTNRENTTA